MPNKSFIEKELERYPMQDNVVDTIKIFAKVLQKARKELRKKICYDIEYSAKGTKETAWVKWSDIERMIGRK